MTDSEDSIPDPKSPESSEVWRERIEAAFAKINGGTMDSVRLLANSQPIESSGEDTPRRILLPGSFSPLHHGHVEMAQTAAGLLNGTVDFELSISNADKPSIQPAETIRRLLPSLNASAEKISGQPDPDHTTFRPHGLWLTAAPTYLAKARLFPNHFFAIGTDTIVRVANPKFYGDSIANRDRAIAELSDLGCRFLVFGRVSIQSQFLEMDDLDLPDPLRQVCDAVPESDFRADVSSTQLREDSL